MEGTTKEILDSLYLTAVFTENITIIKYLHETCEEFKQDDDGFPAAVLRAVDKSGNTALHLAVKYNNGTEIVEYLIGQGADVKARGRLKRTSFQRAFENPDQIWR